jgi:hypothetical protein
MTTLASLDYNARMMKDAGLLREYISTRYEHEFVCGFSVQSFSKVLWLCGRVASLTGIPRDAVFDQIAAELNRY